MSAWDELVTTALLGTERRSLPDGLPGPVARLARAQDDRALAVLEAAAGYAALRRGGARPGRCPEPPPAPRQDVNLAPEPAQALLGSLLRSRETALVEVWLRTCVERGLGVRAGWWSALATAAAAPTGPDRRLVRAALGSRGRAFLAANPRWRAVAHEPAASSVEPPATPPETAARAALSEHDPDRAALLLGEVPGPWDDTVARAALRLLASGAVGPRTARRVLPVAALRLPPSTLPLVADLAEAERDGEPRAGFVEAERVLGLRAEIDRCFLPAPGPQEHP